MMGFGILPNINIFNESINFKKLKNKKPFCMINSYPEKSHPPMTLMEGRRSEKAKTLTWKVTLHSILWEEII